MNTPQKSPIDQLNGQQISFASQTGYRQADFPYQVPKIDHAFIIENYRRLRMHQRDQLARLRMSDQLKRKIFNFRQDQDLKYQKPQLVIFNHPFRGKTVMTREQVQKQLQKQRKNAELGQQKNSKEQKITQNLMNEMGLNQEHVTLQKAKMTRQAPTQKEEEYEKKAKLSSQKPQKHIAQDINKEQQKKMGGELMFISKERKNQESQQGRTEKMKKLIKQKQSSQQKQFTSRSKSKQNKNFRDIPIIGQEPIVLRDIKFDQKDQGKNRKNVKQSSGSKGFYRPFGNETEIRQIQRQNTSSQQNNLRGSGQGFLKKGKQLAKDSLVSNKNRSLSQISAIQSKELQEEDLSNSQSLNNALFMD